jgi:hypothetical protein
MAIVPLDDLVRIIQEHPEYFGPWHADVAA